MHLNLNKLNQIFDLNVDWSLFFVGCVMGCSDSYILVWEVF